MDDKPESIASIILCTQARPVLDNTAWYRVIAYSKALQAYRYDARHVIAICSK